VALSIGQRKVVKMQELRVLLVAPDTQIKLENKTEIAQITDLEQVRVRVLPGYVSARSLYEAVKDGRYDIIHFASHSNADYISLNGDKLSASDLRQVCNSARAQAVFFNSCGSVKMGSALVQRGIEYAISTTVELADSDAWKMPLLFYESLNNQITDTGTFNIPQAFFATAPGDGTYNLMVALASSGMMPVQKRLADLQRQVWWLFGLLTAETVGVAALGAYVLQRS
jgi:hypothetical protein